MRLEDTLLLDHPGFLSLLIYFSLCIPFGSKPRTSMALALLARLAIEVWNAFSPRPLEGVLAALVIGFLISMVQKTRLNHDSAAEIRKSVIVDQVNNILTFIIPKIWDWLKRLIRGPGQVVGTLPDESLAGQEQINDNLKRMEEFLDDDKAKVLGIYGMGGIGKTTLLRLFNDKLVGSNSRRRFDHIIFIEVSKSPKIKRIKRDIEEQIHGKLSSLSQNRFLLLLDDVWKEVDLMSWGIPIPSSENKCKVIMTGRSRLCCRIRSVNRLDATRSFEVLGLSESEAWIFFQRNVGRNLNSEGGEIAMLAKSVANKCSGHPLALEVVGKSMENAKSDNEWREAKRMLIKAPQMIEGFEDVLRLMKFSFDRLRDDNIRNCLLYICLWGEDKGIPKDDLIDYWFGEGFLDCDESKSLYEARDRGQKNITTLVSCSLLQIPLKDNRYVRMHDVVLDMCLWLTSGKFYAYIKGDHNDSSSTPTLTNVQRLSAKTNWHQEEKTLPRDFILSPNLQTLLCGRNYYPSFQIKEGFFQNCTSLRVLELKTCVLNFAMEDLTSLKQLRYLGLSCTKLKNLPDEIDSLSNLVYLDLSWNENLEILPDTIGNLLELQKLDLSYTRLKVLPRTIGSLTKLEILCLSKVLGLEFLVNDAFIGQTTFRRLAVNQCAKMQFTQGVIHDLYNLRHLVMSDAPSSLDSILHCSLNYGEFESLPCQLNALTLLFKMLFSNQDQKLSYFNTLKELDLSQRELSTIPDSIGHLTMLRELDLSKTKVSTLPNSMGNLKALRVLRLAQTKVLELPKSVCALIKLKELNLSQTKISILPESIGDLKHLDWLSLSQTKVSTLPNSIGVLKVLRYLDFSQTNISILPDSIDGLLNLEWLSLSQTKVSILPDSIGALKMLRVLNLSQTKVSNLPNSIGALKELRALNLSQTKVLTLPDSIGTLKELICLNLSQTKVSLLPESIGALTMLKALDLSQTKILILPNSIGEIKNLDRLSLSQTEVSTLPDSIGALKLLSYLDLSQTKVSVLPESIRALTMLKYLYLSQTKISIFPDSIRALTNLDFLDLSQTKLSTLPNLMGALKALQVLNLSQTKVSTLPDSIGALKQLWSLDLSQTKVSVLPESIGALKKLGNLNLSQTKVSVLPESIRALTKLKRLNLSQTKISIIPDSIGALTNLDWLNVSQTKVSTLPDSIGALPKLRYLGFSQTKVLVLPESIRALKMLTT